MKRLHVVYGATPLLFAAFLRSRYALATERAAVEQAARDRDVAGGR